MGNIHETTNLKSFAVKDQKGEIRAIVTNPKFWGGAALGVIGAMGVSGEVLADEPTDTNQEKVVFVAVEGDSPWLMMIKNGFTEKEAWNDIVLRHGISQEIANQFVMQVGDTWEVSPLTIAERIARDPDYASRNNKDGENQVIPQPPAVESQVEISPELPQLPTEEPSIIYLNPGETISGEVKELNIDDPNGVIQQILEANQFTFEDATSLTTEDPITIPQELSDEFSQRVNQRIETEITQPVPGLGRAYLLGDSISVGMKNLGNIEEQAYALGIDMDVNAKGGISLGNALKTVDIEALLSYNAVVIELGTNAPESDEEYESTLRDFLTTLHQTAFQKGIKAPMVYIVNLHEAPGADVKISDEDRNPILGQIVYDYAAMNERIALIDWNDFATKNPFVYAGSDGIHPSDYPTMSTFVLDQMTTHYVEPKTNTFREFPVGEYEMPSDSYWKLAPGYFEMIQSMDLSEDQKQFLAFALEAVMHELANGKEINPRVALAMAIHETGWGTSYLAREGLNLFGYKATTSWLEQYPDRYVLVFDDEYDEVGNKIQSKFKKYSSLDESFADYAALISRADHYADARMCRFDDLGYAYGLVHELRMDGSCDIGRQQGESGVMSYATDPAYVDKLMRTIERNGLDKLIIVDESVRQQMLTSQWIAQNGN